MNTAWFQMILLFLFCGLLPAPTVSQAANDGESAKLLQFIETEHNVPTPLLPAGAAVRDSFEPGEGKPAGSAQLVSGAALVLHKGSLTAFKLRKDTPVFIGDTLITEKNSRVTLLMADNTVLTLTAQSKLVLDRAVYKPEEGRRDTKLQLLLGRMRVIVAKLGGASSFMVRTPTALAGVRGTDFALAVGPAPDSPSHLMTAVLTGGGRSFVEVSSAAGGRPALLCPQSVISAEEGKIVGKPDRVCWRASKLLRRVAPEIGMNCNFIFKSK